ncbi:hypothetical protein F4813DRAFT_385091 [Daldinia decipiens]|uniref:uncharacterized protein n=1 Tax=Daldinia decipiens TaxID=326647 RepID=UPI0020C42E38|nr:uncharacterized protein F4813DRAFT_385091 [Daldinia decipiens]KAI1662377.1 hypothetical protein F4813DRAFT_385091 [Daldinia decipiens]
MTTKNPKQTIRPIYTKEDLNKIEAELERAGLFIEYRGRGGSYFRKLNPLPAQGLIEAPPHTQITRNSIDFKGERALNFAISQGREQWFTPFVVTTRPFRGPNLSSDEAIKHMESEIKSWESSAMCKTIFKTLQDILPTNINKIIAFGLGQIGDLELVSPIRMFDVQSYREHALLLTIARALNERKGTNQGSNVAVYLQDPAYTTVCKSVLSGTYGFRIINGFGARGFTMVDENTLVMGHHPSFPLREIIADIARPAAMCWPPPDPTRFQNVSQRHIIYASDVESVRVDEMLKEYEEVSFPGFRSKHPVPDHDHFQIEWMEEPFYDNVWYVRKPKA